MSLTHYFEYSNPVRDFLRGRFSATSSFLADARKQMRSANVVVPDGSSFPWMVVGSAIDYRLRYYLSVTPWNGLVASHAVGMEPLYERFFHDLQEWLSRNVPVGKRLTKEDEDELNRYCYVLALLEDVARNVGYTVHSPLIRGLADDLPSNARILTQGIPHRTVRDLLDIPEGHVIDDLRRLSWRFYDECHDLLSLHHVLNPTFEGSADVGGADADLILGRTLIEIKTTKKAEIRPDWMRQLLAYALLDYSNQYDIGSVGFYFPRQGLFLQWSLDEVMQNLCDDSSLSFGELRSQFKAIAQQRAADA